MKLYIMEGIQEGVEDHIIDSEECDEEMELEEVEIEITLNALLGIPSPKTMRVVSNIQNQRKWYFLTHATPIISLIGVWLRL